LEQAVGSETRVKLLRSLFHGYRTLDVHSLVLETGKSRAGVYKAVRELHSADLVFEETRGKTAFYGLVNAHPLFEPLDGMFQAEARRQPVAHLMPAFWNHLEGWVSRLAKVPTVKFALLFGSILRPPLYPDADVDVLLAVEDPGELPTEAASILGHPVSVTPMQIDTYWRRRKENDPFLMSVLERHVFLYQSPDYAYPWATGRKPTHGGKVPGPRAF
jgi:predicted nucleotidyltransferase